MRVSVTPPFLHPVLAVGAELKNTVCAGRGTEALVSESHGDLADPSAYRRFTESVKRSAAHFDGRDYVVAHDLHPSLLSTQFARRQPQPTTPIQHHHAHGVSCAVDAGVPLPVIAVVCDGMGYGTDGAAWGGEVLLCRVDSFERLAHLDYFALPGGDAAARYTWRPAMSLLRSTFPDEWQSVHVPGLESVDTVARKAVARQLEVGLNAPNTSSLGRLFDAVAFLSGVCAANTYEGQAAIELQAAAAGVTGGSYAFSLLNDGETVRIDWRPMIREIVHDVGGGARAAMVSARFHETIAAMFAIAVTQAVRRTGLTRVVLSGGCFLNKLLRARLAGCLEESGLTVGCHRRLSPGDAGLSLGQAVIASAIAARNSPARKGP
jgi:hydrogenase maturation protein HypF